MSGALLDVPLLMVDNLLPCGSDNMPDPREVIDPSEVGNMTSNSPVGGAD